MRQVVRTLLRNSEGKYLLVMHHKSDTWTIPGGHIEEWEPLHKALKREIKEEFNMKIKFLGDKPGFWLEYIKEFPSPIANYRIHYHSVKFGKVKKWEYVFHCEVKDAESFKVQEKEIKEYKWFTPEEILKLENIFPQVPRLLENIVD